MNTGTTTTSTSKTKPFCFNDIFRVEEMLKDMNLNKDWLLVSPTGHQWKGKLVELLHVLLPLHPILQTPVVKF